MSINQDCSACNEYTKAGISEQCPDCYSESVAESIADDQMDHMILIESVEMYEDSYLTQMAEG